MKKFLALILAVLMVAAIVCLAGCTSPQQTGNTNNETSSTNNETAGGKTGGIAKDQIKVGVIHIGNPSDGSGYSYTHDLGIVDMQKRIGLRDDQIIRKNNVNDTDAAATKKAILECIDDGCQIIFTTSFGYMETTAELAESNPDVIFSHATGFMSNGINFNNYFGRIYQARYLSGIVAGLKTKTNKIGYVSAMDITNAECTGGIDAFAKGIAAVNPEAKVYVKVTNSWFDPTLEKQSAEALLDLGCDVIGQHCDTAEPQLAAEARGCFGCGYNSNMTEQAPKGHLTAPIWHWGEYYTSAVQAAIDGTWKQFGNYYGGMVENFVDLSPLSENCPENAQAIIDAVKALIVKGEFGVFDGKQVAVAEDGTVSLIDEALKDNAGNEVVAAGGACLDDATITGKINWYYSNVELK